MAEEDENQDSSGGKKRFSDADFAAARELYELGKAGIAELADEYGITRQTLSKKFKDAGAKRGIRAHEVAGAAGAAAKAIEERYAEKRAQWIEETRLESVKTLKQARMLAQKVVTDQARRAAPGTPLNMAAVDDDLKALGRYNKILIDNFQSVLGILNADEHIDEDDLPILTVEDLTGKDILEHHKLTGALDEDATLEDLNLEI